MSEPVFNGAESLVQTLINNEVNVCFANPGTSEMHFVSAVGKNAGMRSILGLFEGVCTGAADGYARMTGKPACTLLHLGPGLSNGLANLHNGRRAGSPIVNIVGDHATYHQVLDAPLASDIRSLAAPVSGWVHSSKDAVSLPLDGINAVKAARSNPGQVATLIVPADCAWNESIPPLPADLDLKQPGFEEDNVKSAAMALGAGQRAVMLMSSDALQAECLELADRIAQSTGCEIYCDTFNAKLARGEGRAAINRLAYFAEQAQEQLAGVRKLILVGTKAPVSFFAYPGKASRLQPDDCEVVQLSSPSQDSKGALQGLADELSAASTPRLTPLTVPEIRDGPNTSETIGRVFSALMPANAIVVDEGATAGGGCYDFSEAALSHDWLFLTGGAIGFGLPNAVGCAVACPDRKVICLHGDGGAMYTLQSLWTMAREELDVCVVIFSNHKYLILQIELARVGAQNMNKKTLDMLDLSNPEIDFVKLSQAMGVPASRVSSTGEFNQQFDAAMHERGPRLIEVEL